MKGMPLSNLWNRLWEAVSHLGVTPEKTKENALTLLLNRVTFVTSCATALYAALSYCLFGNFAYTATSILLSVAYGIPLALHYFHQRKLAKFYLSALLPIWVYAVIVVLGGNFSQSAAMVASLTLVYILFEKEKNWRYGLSAYNILGFIGSLVFKSLYGTLLPEKDYPYDEIGVFLVVLAWIYLILKLHDEEKERLIIDLRKKNQQLQSATEELERYANIASHDLKSPLRSIISFSDLMERDLNRGKTDELRQYLEHSKSAAYQMDYLVQGILELSRIERSKPLIREKIQLDLLLGKVKANLKEELAAKNACLKHECLPEFFGNESELITLFQNLIHNGIHYNQSPTPTVSIGHHFAVDGSLVLQFTDNGIGIDPSYHAHIFEHFKRLHTAAEYTGSGLGLSICRKIAQHYAGNITLRSKEGDGTTFTVTLMNMAMAVKSGTLPEAREDRAAPIKLTVA